MKKAITLFMSILMVFTLAACGSQTNRKNSQNLETQSENNAPESEQETSQQTDGSATPESEQEISKQTGGNNAPESGQEPSQQTDEAPTETPTESTNTEGEGSKTLVVYYSASGNTEAVAGYIAAATDADILELVPVNAYTDDDLDWTTEGSRVNKEHDDESLRNIELAESTVSDWDSYDTVFIGYPIWWGIAAWPVNGFIRANDFTGKTVIPFCTSASSGLGESGKLLAEAAGTGNWLEGQRFSSRPSQEDVLTWVNSLGLQ